MKELGVFKQMTQLAYLPIYHKLLCGAMELDVFSKLNTPVTAAELAGNESWNPANTEYMLGALRALGFLKHEDGRYVNTAETGKYLSAELISEHFGKSACNVLRNDSCRLQGHYRFTVRKKEGDLFFIQHISCFPR